MRTAVLADIHSNREALEACLAHADSQGAQHVVFLGDLVGYGADPIACLDIVRRRTDASCVLGNHDAAALGGLCEDMHPVAREATYWTRRQLSDAERSFLSSLPLTQRTGELLYVHASAHQPDQWEYVAGTLEAQRCIDATDAGGVIAGHVHQAQFYFAARGAMQLFVPKPGAPVSLSPRRRWVALAGSVGQPRDGNPAANWLLVDDDAMQITYFRVPYDHHTAARKIRAAGLPDELAQRLERGL